MWKCSIDISKEALRPLGWGIFLNLTESFSYWKVSRQLMKWNAQMPAREQAGGRNVDGVMGKEMKAVNPSVDGLTALTFLSPFSRCLFFL